MTGITGKVDHIIKEVHVEVNNTGSIQTCNALQAVLILILQPTARLHLKLQGH